MRKDKEMTEIITSYFQNIFIISITGTVTEALLSSCPGNTKTLESGLKLVFSLCLLLSVIIPAAEILKSTDISQDFELKYENSASFNEQCIINNTKKQLENEISERIYQQFGIKPTSVCINFVIEETENSLNVSVDDVIVSLEPENSQYKEKATIYAKELLGIDTEHNGE